MGYPTKVQVIKRSKSEQWYVNFPAAVAQAIEFKQGEVVEWLIDLKGAGLLSSNQGPLSVPGHWRWAYWGVWAGAPSPACCLQMATSLKTGLQHIGYSGATGWTLGLSLVLSESRC